ncbi:Src y 2 domains-containing protein, partial [Branchiostoma belcheri]
LGYLKLDRTTCGISQTKGRDRGHPAQGEAGKAAVFVGVPVETTGLLTGVDDLYNQRMKIDQSDLFILQVIGAQLRDVWKAYILTIATVLTASPEVILLLCPLLKESKSIVCVKTCFECLAAGKDGLRASCSMSVIMNIYNYESHTMHVVPEDLNLLPGQLIDVRRTLEQETYRLASPPPPVPPHNVNGNVTRSASSSSGYSSGQSGTNMSGSGDSAGSEASSLPPPPAAVEMHAYRFYPDYLKERGRVRPPWFFHLLPRDQVEQVLADNIVNGNMLLRSSDSAPGGLVLSARLPVNGEPQVRHYIVNMTNGHFVLDIDKKHPPILNIYELINYFIDQSGGNVVPLETSELSQLALPAGLYEGDRVVKLDQCPHWGEWSAKPVPKSVVNMLKYSVPPDELHKVQEMSIWNPPSMQLPEVDYDDEPTPIFLEHDDDDVHDYVNCEEGKTTNVCGEPRRLLALSRNVAWVPPWLVYVRSHSGSDCGSER